MVSRALAVVGTVFAILLAPPVCAQLFCLEPPAPEDVVALWLVATALLAWSWLVLARSRRAWVPKVALLFFTLLSVELTARAYVTHFTAWPREKLAKIARATYPDLLAFQPHPFLHFTGRPNRVLVGNQALSIASPFNAQGNPDESVPYAKPPGTCRIVCLGGSTTIPYPSLLRAWLRAQDPAQPFETVNMAHGFYTTAHSVVNFTLNAVDYAPDYVVIHDGWNDARGGDNAAAFRGDYGHVFKAFEAPSFPDTLLLRGSVIWRALRSQLAGDTFEFLDTAILKPVDAELGMDPRLAYAAFARNVRTIVDLALLRGMKPVLATLAHSTDPDAVFGARRPEMEQFAAILRSLAVEYGSRVVFVDLDKELTGKNELFTDVGHMTAAGNEAKARAIGAAILADWRAR